MSVAAQAAASLPLRERGLFQNLVSYYEKRNNEKGLQTADNILKTQPKHAETLSLKGMILLGMDKKEEGLSFIKQGVACNVKSLLCWHLYGVYHRNERNYSEAMKCFKSAVRCDNKNIGVLRDLANMQLQLRDFDGAMATRRMQLVAGFGTVSNWLAYAVAAYLNNCYQLSLTILDSFFALTPIPETPSNEFSQAVLFKVEVYTAKEDYASGLEYLKKNSKFVLDKSLLRELQVRFLIKLQKIDEAKRILAELFVINCNNENYHKLLLEVNGITDPSSNINKVVSLYSKLGEKYPRSDYIRLTYFNYLETEKLVPLLTLFIQQKIRKGVFGLLDMLRVLLKREEINKVILSITETFLQQLKKNETSNESPTALLYCYTFLSQLYYHNKNFDKALEMISQAIAHTPTIPELYIIKARIFKKLGEVHESCETIAEARKLDLYDRYLNVRHCKYLIRDNRHDEALKTFSLFTKDSDGDIVFQISTIQCAWIELERGDAYFREGKIPLAIKQYVEVENHYEKETRDDQFDYHPYALRKGNMKSYLNMLSFCDRMESKKNYARALVGLAKCYFELSLLTPLTEEEKEKIQADRSKHIAETKGKTMSFRGKTVPVDQDPFGDSFRECPNPKQIALEKTLKLFNAVDDFGPNEKYFPKEEILTFAVKVFLANDKYVLALSAIKKALKLFPNSTKAQQAKELFCKQFDSATTLPAIVKEIILKERQVL